MLLSHARAAVDIKPGTNRVDVAIDGQPFTTLHYGGSTMKPYLAPLRTATGKVITRRWPMEKVGGETTDHPHHEGLWFTHGMVNEFDFWVHDVPKERRGRVVVDKITSAKGGADTGEIGFEARWVTPDDKALLRETRVMRFRADGSNRIVDLDITLTAVERAVTFGDTKEGTFAIRLADQLTEKQGSGSMVSASGAKKMDAVWGKPAPWVDYSGQIDGEAVGVAIFDHSKNPKHPTTWHSRDYGLFAANPFGDHDFYRDKTRNGSMTIKPGESLRFRYRVVIHPGDTETARVAELYKKWQQH